MNHYDFLIVGSGLFGATFAHLATRQGKKCLVIDKRPHLGGNVYCEEVTCGEPGRTINVHKYGAHIFHTNNKEVWNFVNSIVPFNRYTNCPVANYKGKLYNLPFNMNTFYQMWGVLTPEEAKAKIEEQKAEAVKMLNGREPQNLEEQALTLVGKDIFEKLIKEYTEKQWGRKCTELPAFIIKRLPVRMIFDNNYFNDKYQGIPIGGYNKLVEGLLEGVECLTDTDFFNSEYRDWQKYADKFVYCGPLDQYFGYQYGKLNWRTVRFETEMKDCPNYQGNAVVNYTSHDEPYTRIIEHKHFEMFGQEVYECPKTVISKEFSTEYKEGMEPYYPVNDEANNQLADKYRQLAQQEKSVIFGGRLAEYKYYDMAPVIERVLSLVIE
ncbi:UDP-galactopyranose mutase [Prevotella sp. E13-17]|uniref:UDP-galactopyranose mutase n=1 Tax=Prevotella sp. E13-17 TaxID=2913616 RepID=UPI001EDA168F|nr:UDP-galactopyranose mutase [Prevotella sp. E13-17]UKK50376.1 UDP-galactopyranose mutase [Prevotella sp. E13-17]